MARTLNPEQMELLRVHLNQVINTSLWAPSGDPLYGQAYAASLAVQCLRVLGLPIDGEEEVMQVLEEYGVC